MTRPATPDTWDDVVAVMGTRGDPSRCWCQYFLVRGRDFVTGEASRERLRAQVLEGRRPPGVLAYDGEQPVGWCQVGPKADYPRLAHSRASAAPPGEPDPPDLWAITCLVVPVPFRRRGVTRALVAGAVELAARSGARAVEAYPVDVAGPTSSAALYHGPLSTFLGCGFTEVRRPVPGRAVVRRDLRPRRPEA